MLKKVIFVMLALLIATSAFAQLQSGPSNKVGYVKIAVSAGTSAVPVSTPFGLPFKFWEVSGNVPVYGTPAAGTWKPSYIIGDQLFHGSSLSADRIVKQGPAATGGGYYAYINTSGVWIGGTGQNLEVPGYMEPGKAYWYLNKHAATSLVLAGEVDNSGNYDTLAVTAPASAASPVSTPLSWRLSRIDSVNKLNLYGTVPNAMFYGGSSLSSDRLMEPATGYFTFYKTSGTAPLGWQMGLIGTTFYLPTVTPGRTYYLINKHVGHPWTYTYNAGGGVFTSKAEPGNENPGIQSIVTPVQSKNTGKTKVNHK